jgi:hypothetical protein
MAKIQTLTDEQLLQRSARVGTTLIVLAVLVTMLAVLLVVLAVMAEVQPKPGSVQSRPLLLSLSLRALPLMLCLAAAGSWMLAVAASRGNPTAPGIVLLVLAFQILLYLAGSYTTLTHGGVPTELLWLAIALLIAAAVSTSRNVLIEIKKRGLWDAQFAAAKPSRGFCVCGGILLVVGYFGANASLFVPAVLAAQNAKEEIEQAKAFLACLKEQEPEAKNALQSLGKTRDSESLKAAMDKVDALDRKVAAIQYEVAEDMPLYSILAKYRRAVAQWKKGLAELDRLEPDAKKVKQHLQSGGSLRTEALSEFDRRFLRH